MSETDFWACELREIFNRINGHSEAEQARQQALWERTRWQSTLLLSVHTKKGQRLKPKDLAVFPWEEEAIAVTVRPLSTEEREAKFRKMDAFIQKKMNG